MREGAFDVPAVVPDFDDEQSSRLEMIRGSIEYRSHEVQTIGSAGERERRLLAILLGQPAHHA